MELNEVPQLDLDPHEERKLREANDIWARALAGRDRQALEEIMSDDFLMAFPLEGDDKSQFIDDIISGSVTVGSLNHRDVTFRVSGNTGLIFGSETANWVYKGRDLSGTYRFLRVYTKQQGRWQILALHLCSPSHR
jgi:ketosteroid isomerase-like protein